MPATKRATFRISPERMHKLVAIGAEWCPMNPMNRTEVVNALIDREWEAILKAKAGPGKKIQRNPKQRLDVS